MKSLFNSGIEEAVNKRIRGRVARIGGTVNQLLDYRDCTVDDINIIDGGFGRISTVKNLKNAYQFFRGFGRRLKQEVNFRLHGPRFPRDSKTFELDMHKATTDPRLKHQYDCSISSNVLEHSPNIIFLLLNFYYITKLGGHQYHVLPHYKVTYDVYRKPTPTEHFFDDLEKMTDESDTSHNEDYIMSAIEKQGYQREFHKKYPVKYPFMHFHVFDETNMRELFSAIFEDVVSDVVNLPDNENVVLFKNTLKPSFLEKYGTVIAKYSPEFLAP